MASIAPMRRIAWRVVPILIALAIAAWRWIGSERFTNPETGESHRVGLTVDQEQALGVQAFDQVLAQSQVIDSGRGYDLVQRVAKRIAAATGDAGRDEHWRAALVRSDQVNAFCLPGGEIVVYSGILPVARDEAGLAVVLGHEVSHAIARHGAQRILRQQSLQTILTGAQFSLGGMDWHTQRAVMGALGAGAQFGLLLPFSRAQESEADAMGLVYMARAGYDPRTAIDFWKRMAEASGADAPPVFASDHPADAQRIADLERLMDRAVAEYERATAVH